MRQEAWLSPEIAEKARLRIAIRDKLGSLSLEMLQSINTMIAVDAEEIPTHPNIIRLADRRRDV